MISDFNYRKGDYVLWSDMVGVVRSIERDADGDLWLDLKFERHKDVIVEAADCEPTEDTYLEAHCWDCGEELNRPGEETLCHKCLDNTIAMGPEFVPATYLKT